MIVILEAMLHALFQSNSSFAAERGEKEINRLRLFREPIRRGNSADGVGDVEAES